ncbi:MAG: RsmB/NOP family class I SAM-dependent RNA methyltransferase [Planctomycetota bacterium]
MNVPSSEVRVHVAAVVAQCLERARAPADAMASMPALRGASPQLRGDVASWSLRTLSARLRLEVALSGVEGQELPRQPAERARLLSLAAMVEAGLPTGSWSAGLPSRERLRAAVDAIDDPIARLAARGAVPRWLASRFAAAFGGEADQVLAGLGEPPPRTLRTNLLRGDRDALQEELGAEGVATEPARFAPTALHCVDGADLFATDAFRDGWFEQQDEASQLAVWATAPPPKGRVLDLCCGSGGKTLGLAAALRNRGAVMAADVHAGRLRELRKRLARARVDNVEPRSLDEDCERVESFARTCDRILIDAPCSGTGSWRRRPQARTAIGERDLDELVRTQRDLLLRAAGWLAPGARLIYATCSLLPEENVAQVDWLRERAPDLELVRLVEILGRDRAAPIADATGTFLQVRPDRHGCDGFFLAVLRRPRGV